MGAMDAWRRLDPWLRLLAVYVALALACFALGAATGWGWDNVAFFLGVALILASMLFVGTGGAHSGGVTRHLNGLFTLPTAREVEGRRRDVNVGLLLLILAMGFWAPLLLHMAMRGGFR